MTEQKQMSEKNWKKPREKNILIHTEVEIKFVLKKKNIINIRETAHARSEGKRETINIYVYNLIVSVSTFRRSEMYMYLNT